MARCYPAQLWEDCTVPLDLPPSSRFALRPEALPDEFVADTLQLLIKISRTNRTANEFDRQNILEIFKQHFSIAIGKPHYCSSSTGYAEFDLGERMKEAKTNAPFF